MALPNGFQQAKLKVDAPLNQEIVCGFNPQSFSVAKTNVFTFKPTQGQDLPKGEFGGGLPRVTKLSLLLDSTLPNPNNTKTVTDQANLLLKMMETGGSAPAPPMVTFIWGAVNLPKSFPINLTIQYILFKPNGEPLRANVDIELAQAEKATTASGGTANASGNPTTRSKRGTTMHVVHDGDSLPSISYGAYGDATRWRDIADANGIDDPMKLRRGRQLTIPRKGM
jgi:hypothetical protein